MRKQITPMYRFYVADFFRSLEWHFDNLHLEVDMTLSSFGFIEIKLPIAEDFICVINIRDEIRLKFYKELLNGKRHYFRIPRELDSDFLPVMLFDIVERDDKGLYIYPSKPVLYILRTISFIQKNGAELLPVLRKAYKATTNKKNYESIN